MNVKYLTAQEANQMVLKVKERASAEKVAVEKQVHKVVSMVAEKAAVGETYITVDGRLLKDAVLILEELGYVVNIYHCDLVKHTEVYQTTVAWG
jgi:uncharacterized metal-binding protein